LQETALKEELTALKGKLTFNETTSEKTSQGKLIVNVMSNEAGNIPLEISYLTNQATWQPSYEMRIDKINAPINMLYKAQVQQNTFAPVLNPWFLDYYTPVAYRSSRNDDVARASSTVTSKTIEGRPNASVIQTLQGQVPGLEISSAPSTINDFTQINENQLNIAFDIDIPYTILSNGKQHSVALKDTQLPATYSYVTIPKLDTNAYLVAKIKNYGDYNILPGEANVIFEGMYVGKTFVNANTNEDDL